MAGVWRPPLKVVWCGTVPYQSAWDWQRRLAAARAQGELAEDVLLLLEHPPVYTMGRGGSPQHLLRGEAGLRASGAEYFEVDRGGSVTFHGPGQLVGYPIVNLEQLGIDPFAYLRALEDALIDSCQMLGVDAFREPPYTGVWNHQGKLAAFDLIVPCGIEGRGATSLQEAGASGDLRPVALAELVSPFVAHALGLRWEAGNLSELGIDLPVGVTASPT